MRRLAFISAVVASWALMGGAAVKAVDVGVGLGLSVVPVAHKKVSGKFIYASKVVCGTIKPGATFQVPLDNPRTLVPGHYLTNINIHNPQPLTVAFTKRGVLGACRRKTRTEVIGQGKRLL